MKLLKKSSRNHVKRQKSVIFVKKKLKINIWKITKYRKVRDHCHFTGNYGGTAHSICKLEYTVPKKLPIALHNGTHYDYHFIIKELVEEFKKIYLFRIKHWKIHNLYSSNRKGSYKNLKKIWKKLWKIYPTYYNLLRAQDLWQAYYQILSIYFLK